MQDGIYCSCNLVQVFFCNVLTSAIPLQSAWNVFAVAALIFDSPKAGQHAAPFSKIVKDKQRKFLSEDTYPVSIVPGMFEAFSSVMEIIKHVLLGFQSSLCSVAQAVLTLLYVPS